MTQVLPGAPLYAVRLSGVRCWKTVEDLVSCSALQWIQVSSLRLYLCV